MVDTPGVVTFSNCSFKMDQSETVVVDLHADREVSVDVLPVPLVGE